MKFAICLFISVLLFGCSHPIHRNNEITKIEFARSGAWAEFGVSISIDSTLNYKYWGDYKNAKQKYFVGKVSEGFWDTLNIKLEGIKFKTVVADTGPSCIDCEYYELIVHWKNKIRRIKRAGDQSQDSIINVFKWIGNNQNIPKLKEVKDSIRFETNTHLEQPKPRVKSIKFPPPQIK